MLIQNERIICIRFCPFWNGFSTQILSRLGVCLRDNLASAQTKTDGGSSPHVTQFIYFYPVPFLNISPFSGGGISLRFRDGGLGPVQRLHWSQLWRALSPRGRACALRSRSWRARGPRGRASGLHHLRARGRQDGAQDREAAPGQGQPDVPELAVLLMDGHGNYRDNWVIITEATESLLISDAQELTDSFIIIQ